MHSLKTMQPQDQGLQGQALVEFALVIMLLVVLLAATIDFGRAVFNYGAVYNAAREGARYGSVHPTDVTGIQNAARALTGRLDPLSVVVGYSGSRINVTVVYEYRPATPLLTPFMGGSDFITLRSTSSMLREDSY